ncbi:hypothetical protein A3A39_03160 [Candidatus Kaiserbacteria bacterium RIFCSPLOWO2_01_FULL_54_13]|uniref:Uncharacterized protein n=1 Tax=Candidatus Kaiserbacteria bacterium RIFCSPLOWO2_01_FULL_54_13 TaxID=1798512 RepID=A0A1F6F490_9BACT|nr:MAG: hypothetical protein A3A39_03160 [Candidatus Kaiserbacteria bacterium RIFCSPLOWO2_01_FULL_54_13]
MTPEELRKQLDVLLEAGDEKALERFVLDHFTEFPEDVQGKLALSFYTDALEKEAADGKVMDIQEKGLETMRKLKEMKEALSSKEEKKS